MEKSVASIITMIRKRKLKRRSITERICKFFENASQILSSLEGFAARVFAVVSLLYVLYRAIRGHW